MSNNTPKPHASFSDDSNATFLIRWRGKQEGPFTAAAIEAKLAANQIGLLHEISHGGQWLTLRDYLAGRDVILRAERQAREEQERQATIEGQQHRDILAAKRAPHDDRVEDLEDCEIAHAAKPGTNSLPKWPWVALIGVITVVLAAWLVPETRETFGASVVLLIAVALYLLPSIAAAINKNPNWESIAVINLFLGWTFIGWVIALAWAFKKS